MKTRYLLLIVLAVLSLVSCSQLPTPGGGTGQPGQPTSPGAGTLSAATSTLVETTSVTDLPVLPTVEPVLPSETVPPPTPTLVPTPTPHFVLQPGTPLGSINFAQPELSCYWMGVGGQVLGPDGAPLSGMVVEAGGELGGNQVSYLGITGNHTVFGPGGYLITLAGGPIASDGTLWLQLYDAAGDLQSQRIFVTTYAECERNLLIVNFSESSTVPEVQISLPIIKK